MDMVLQKNTKNPDRARSWFARENWAALITWGAFSYIQFTAAARVHGMLSWQTMLLCCSLILFIGIFLQTQQELSKQRQWLQLGGMWLMLALNAVLVPDGFTPGLAVLWVCLLPWYVPERYVYWMIVPALAPHAAVNMFDSLSTGDVIMLITCGTFQFFAIFAMSKARSESIAREALALTHQQLLQAQSQLAEKAADTERLRIARDLHDSLGHHLTALVIQLQVAGYQAEERQKPQLEHCHQLAKQLLQDIRHSVTRLREPHKPHLASQCRALAQNFPQLNLDCQIKTDLEIDPLSTALLFRVCQEALTNSIRHSHASQAKIEVWSHQAQWYLRYQDNGECPIWPIQEGNGLRGMRERIEEAGGSLLFSPSPASATGQISLQIDVRLPEVNL